jgi:hypothetical protein
MGGLVFKETGEVFAQADILPPISEKCIGNYRDRRLFFPPHPKLRRLSPKIYFLVVSYPTLEVRQGMHLAIKSLTVRSWFPHKASTNQRHSVSQMISPLPPESSDHLNTSVHDKISLHKGGVSLKGNTLLTREGRS